MLESITKNKRLGENATIGQTTKDIVSDCVKDRRDTDRREVVRSVAEYGSEADSRIA